MNERKKQKCARQKCQDIGKYNTPPGGFMKRDETRQTLSLNDFYNAFKESVLNDVDTPEGRAAPLSLQCRITLI